MSNIEFPFIYDSLANYQYTVQMLQQIVTTQQITMLVTGHGDATNEVVEIQKRIEESIQYLNDLEKTVRTNTPFDVTNLLAKYPFPNGLEKCHQENMSLCRKELLGMKN